MQGRELQHYFHEHPLILKVERSKDNGGNDDPMAEIKCDGCEIPISGPFYSCEECQYFMHKVCAELPSALDYPLHPQHPLTLINNTHYTGYRCNSCREKLGSKLIYHCSECRFNVDMQCASATHKIKDKCHPHPLTPLQVPITFVCHICRKKEEGLSYKCYSCPFWVHQNCTLLADTFEHSHHEDPYPFRELQHVFHKHPLVLIANEGKTEIKCNGCDTEIWGPFYSCGKCRYFLHKVCAELPKVLDHPLHPEHPLFLLHRTDYWNKIDCSLCRIHSYSKMIYFCHFCKFYLDMKCATPYVIHDKRHPHPLTSLQVPITFVCHICRKKEEGLSYKCYSCPFWVHQSCTLLADTFEHSHHEDPYPFRELQLVFHDHPLVLIANEGKIEIKCNMCMTQILGPFYSCGKCQYVLHKVCAELPNVLDHPLHPEHPLTLSQGTELNKCSLCRRHCYRKFIYTCSKCEFYVDTKCASATHVIHDKCHPHPLTPSQDPISFPCHICLGEEKSPSYWCNACPFRVHQNCTLLPDTTKHSYHRHILKLFPSIPFKHLEFSESCDICHDKLFMFQCIYGCDTCLFFAHVGCARSETMSPPPSRDQDTNGQSVIRLPMNQDSWFVGNSIDEDANIGNKTDHFAHEHPLSLISDEKTTDNKTCEACAVRISSPSYGCVECGYFLHKYCCTDLPKQISCLMHPEHRLVLRSAPDFFRCDCCGQWCNSFSYKCSECEYFEIDIKCASLSEGTRVYHEAHKHPLLPRINRSNLLCTAGDLYPNFSYILECNTCSFVLCFRCAMAPRVIKHRYGKSEPFRLTYSPPENHHSEYICEICLRELNPKRWYYHCVFADQFAHIRCMVRAGADSNIKYGKSHMLKNVYGKSHEHEVTTISCMYDCSTCSSCRHPMRNGFVECVGFECKTCKFRAHLYCPLEYYY